MSSPRRKFTVEFNQDAVGLIQRSGQVRVSNDG